MIAFKECEYGTVHSQFSSMSRESLMSPGRTSMPSGCNAGNLRCLRDASQKPTMPSGCFAKTPKASLRHRSGIVETRAVSPGSSMFPESANRTTRAVSPGSAIRTTQETRRKHRIALPRGHRNRTKGETRRGHHIRTTPETSRLHTTCTIFLALALRV